ncbi:hypothetical protein [Francisella sp. LA112445]|uniref:LVIVD repeat-containing protein n=1 Tax=Francisella sp. LA112445 TaxID=1395624 RepID=UPI001788D2AD|nr:hypothetical protein [Francisella sp. LA112445]QIW10994.1 hypothetical protein FIP56_09930 [Francisella sp. LA112445]
MRKFTLLTFAFCIFIYSNLNAQSLHKVNYKVIKTIHDDKNFNYVAISRIYKKYPNTMFLTMRGGGVTSLDISTPSEPKILDHWQPKQKVISDVEGQDLINDTLVVAGRNGFLYLLNVSNPKNIKLIKSYKVPGFNGEFSLLHDKIYEQNKKIYVAASSALTNKLVIIEITNNNPKLINSIKTVKGIEGIYIKKYNDHVYAIVGGFFSNSVEVLDITNPKDIKHTKTIIEPYYLQMCPSTAKNSDVLYMALWGGKCGGLASFNIKDPANIKELSHTCTQQSAKANRVRIENNYAFLPLEQEDTGAFSIVDISNPHKLKQVAVIRNIPNIKKSYTLSVKDDYVYIFGSKDNNLTILKLKD